jgi:hypothetical protein
MEMTEEFTTRPSRKMRSFGSAFLFQKARIQ